MRMRKMRTRRSRRRGSPVRSSGGDQAEYY